MSYNKKNQNEDKNVNGDAQISRAPLPQKNQIIGIIEQRYGGNKMKVNCLDGKERNCRVPGRLKRTLWLRPNDAVLVELWELDKEKGDIILKYNDSQIQWLKRNGYLKTEETKF